MNLDMEARRMTAIIMRMTHMVSFQVHTISLFAGSAFTEVDVFTLGQKRYKDVIALAPVTIASAIYSPLISRIV